MSKKLYLSGYLLVRNILIVLLLALQLVTLTVNAFQLIAYAERNRLVYKVTASFNEDTLVFIPYERLDMMSEADPVAYQSIMDAIDRVFDENNAVASTAAVGYTGCRVDGQEAIKLLRYDNAWFEHSKIKIDIDGRLSSRPELRNIQPVYLQGAIADQYSLGDTIDIQWGYYSENPATLTAYVAGFVDKEQFLIFPTTGATFPSLDSISSDETISFFEVDKLDRNLVLIPADSVDGLMSNAFRMIFMSKGADERNEQQIEESLVRYGTVSTLGTMRERSSFNDFDLNINSYARSIALVLFSGISIVGFISIWILRNTNVIKVFYLIGLRRRDIVMQHSVLLFVIALISYIAGCLIAINMLRTVPFMFAISLPVFMKTFAVLVLVQAIGLGTIAYNLFNFKLLY